MIIGMMIDSLEDLLALRESEELEFKLAQGRDGKGALPNSFWETYSAFANTRGGFVVLGVRETHDGFETVGVENAERITGDLRNQLNNRQKISADVLQEGGISSLTANGREIVIVRVPPASRRLKPVYVGANPLTGTYRRSGEGDRACDAESVRQMLAEQTQDSRDNRVLAGFGLDDLHRESIDVYRRLLRDSRPGHPFLELDGEQFLRAVGAWRRDREIGTDGLTVAGLLMFGTSEAIREEFPNYALDYQERGDARVDRWVDRVVPDGSWSGNIFEFYRTVWRKLTSGLKIPFHLRDGQRQDETAVHVALREALVNSLVHADYTGRASLLIVRRPDMFGFRNPGLMRVPIETAIRGGESDGRNRTLQQMFLLIGAGERAGSGVPKIHQGWRDQHWRPPSLAEKREPSEQTLLELHMEDLLPPAATDELRESLGDAAFEALQPEERVILVTALLESTVSHARAMSLCELHPSDVTRLLQGLVQRGHLIKSGASRGSKYRLPGTALPDPDAAFPAASFQASDPQRQPRDLEAQPPELSTQPSDLPSRAPEVAARDGRTIPGLSYPLLDDLETLSPALRAELADITGRTMGSGKVPTEVMREVITALCEARYVTLRVLSDLLNRADDYLRQSHLNPMVAEGRLIRAFPQTPNDPRQAYAAATSANLEATEQAALPR